MFLHLDGICTQLIVLVGFDLWLKQLELEIWAADFLQILLDNTDQTYFRQSVSVVQHLFDLI